MSFSIAVCNSALIQRISLKQTPTSLVLAGKLSGPSILRSQVTHNHAWLLMQMLKIYRASTLSHLPGLCPTFKWQMITFAEYLECASQHSQLWGSTARSFKKKKMPLMGISSVVERLPGVCEALGSEKNPWPLKTCPGLGRKEDKLTSWHCGKLRRIVTGIHSRKHKQEGGGIDFHFKVGMQVLRRQNTWR